MATVLDMLELLLPQDLRRGVVDGLGEHEAQTGVPADAKEIAAAIVRDPQAWRTHAASDSPSDADRPSALRDTPPRDNW